MSTSESDDSIDWLASDEDGGPKSSSPHRAEESPLPLPPPASERLSAAPRRRPSGRRRGGAKTPPETEEELFSQKSAELQRYLQPLSSMLQDLRSGRYSSCLSSFQERVAMDRIQRIMGVLENPLTGGRVLLKVEAMLHSWFPHAGPPAEPKRHGGASSPPPSSLCSSRRLHPLPVCILTRPGPRPGRRRQGATQDSSVSSSTDSPPRRLGFKVRSPCLERLLLAKESVVAPRAEREELQGLNK
ncbi:circadian-associated transcriptional repressor-like isoform X2 [Pseudoliparis swirei]|uniref:circadian-associated transcriptional repressor-like isoform X2 n=1 Tax=Pseudoliparis swirei TaxID=2059687 RepID=UPI0024BEBE94|nr:circadian-associated transcriptional repressor-like isoform X2 [Pseudoliparis swirei]